jgi:hypothetical protein
VDGILKGRELDNDDDAQGIESGVNVSGWVSGKLNWPLSDRNSRSMFAPSLDIDPGNCAIVVSSSGWPIQFMSISPGSRKSRLLQSNSLGCQNGSKLVKGWVYTWSGSEPGLVK